MKTLTVGLLAVLLCGCARINQTVRTSITGTNGIIETHETKSRLTTFFDSKQTLDKVRVSNGKTQSIGLAGVDQESSGTNFNKLLESVVSAAVKAAVKP